MRQWACILFGSYRRLVHDNQSRISIAHSSLCYESHVAASEQNQQVSTIGLSDDFILARRDLPSISPYPRSITEVCFLQARNISDNSIQTAQLSCESHSKRRVQQQPLLEASPSTLGALFLKSPATWISMLIVHRYHYLELEQIWALSVKFPHGPGRSKRSQIDPMCIV